MTDRPCPLCTGELMVLGTLGETVAQRCRHCGMTFTLVAHLVRAEVHSDSDEDPDAGPSGAHHD